MKLCTVFGVVTGRAGPAAPSMRERPDRSRHEALYTTQTWQRLSARMLRARRGEHGSWCPGSQRAAHGASDVTAVLCRSFNLEGRVDRRGQGSP